jgi:hypothetical protein
MTTTLDDVLQKVLNATGTETEIRFDGSLKGADAVLPGFVTLDPELEATIKTTLSTIESYVKTATERRPCNFILMAEPGSGKSHFVKCIARRCGLPPITANIASLDRVDDLSHWIDEARNHKAEDRIPLLFIDEADAKPEAISSYLPLLWDGIFFTRGRELQLGRCTIVLAVSDAGVIKKIENPDDVSAAVGYRKLDDFLSRINGGVIRMSPIDERRRDKLCLAMALIQRRFPKAVAVELVFLKLLVNTSFLHAVRSMETLINYFPLPNPAGVIVADTRFSQLMEKFLNKKSFRENLFSFHLSNRERLNTDATWQQFRESKCIVSY